MPIYEYVCSACGRRIDVIHGINGTGPATCEVCGGAMRKALTAPAIHFKGSGWAKKDARTSAAPAATPAKTDDAAAPAAVGGTETAAPAADAAAAPAPAPAPAKTPAAASGGSDS
jgi:putative FmdB family regulatory protein